MRTDEKIVLFGAGSNGKYFGGILIMLEHCPAYFVDNIIQDGFLEILGKYIPVYKPDVLLEENRLRLKIFITHDNFHLIATQLTEIGLGSCVCHFNSLVADSKIGTRSCPHPIFDRCNTPVLWNEEKQIYYKENFGLKDYHIRFYNRITSAFDFSNKTVLEIGGSNTPLQLAFEEMRVKKWICIDNPCDRKMQKHKNHYKDVKFFKYEDNVIDAMPSEHDYIVYKEFAEYMPENFFSRFDIVISLACFEHILNLALVLDRAYDVLKPGGVLLTDFGPIFSSKVGTHLNISDEDRSFIVSQAKGYPPVLEHSHLLMGYYELYSLLDKTYGEDIAFKYTLQIKHGENGFQTLNKLFYEDYLFLVDQCKFDVKAIYPASRKEIDLEKMKALISMYPGYYRFDVNSIGIEAIK